MYVQVTVVRTRWYTALSRLRDPPHRLKSRIQQPKKCTNKRMINRMTEIATIQKAVLCFERRTKSWKLKSVFWVLLDGLLLLLLFSFVPWDEGFTAEVASAVEGEVEGEVVVEVVFENVGLGSSFVLDHHAHFSTLEIMETFPFGWISRIKGSEGHNFRPLISLGFTRAYSSLIPIFSFKLLPELCIWKSALPFCCSFCFDIQSVFVRAFERYDSGVLDPSPWFASPQDRSTSVHDTNQ